MPTKRAVVFAIFQRQQLASAISAAQAGDRPWISLSVIEMVKLQSFCCCRQVKLEASKLIVPTLPIANTCRADQPLSVARPANWEALAEIAIFRHAVKMSAKDNNRHHRSSF
jgi:hypothetical protein